MKVISYTIVHYGADYISWAIRSIYNQVDEAHIFYTPTPSHGHQTDVPPPETRDQIRRAAYSYDPDNKIRWFDFNGITNEGPQRDKAVEMVTAAGADLILVVDVDEIWSEATLQRAIDFVWTANRARNWLINFTHLWRSFNWCCRDDGWPVRFIDTRHDGKEVGYVPKDFGEIYHFGYCIRDAILEYKIKIHGHKADFRQNWLDEKWRQWQPGVGDVHPTNEKNFWTPEPFDKKKLPGFMAGHPFYDLERGELNHKYKLFLPSDCLLSVQILYLKRQSITTLPTLYSVLNFSN